MVALCQGTLAKLRSNSDYFRSAAAGGDRLIDVFHVRIHAAKLALALWPAFAQRSDGARLDDLEKVEPCRGADVLALSGVKPFEARLHRRDICAGICKVAIAAR